MKKSYRFSAIVLAVFVVTTSFAQHPCYSMAQACKKAGYYHGGASVHRGLVAHCLLPLVNQHDVITLNHVSDDERAQCRSFLMKSFKQNALK